jgi:hypothetical protein
MTAWVVSRAYNTVQIVVEMGFAGNMNLSRGFYFLIKCAGLGSKI